MLFGGYAQTTSGMEDTSDSGSVEPLELLCNGGECKNRYNHLGKVFGSDYICAP